MLTMKNDLSCKVAFAIRSLPSESCLTLCKRNVTLLWFRRIQTPLEFYHPIQQTTPFHLQVTSMFLGDKRWQPFAPSNKRKLLFFCYGYVILLRLKKLISTCATIVISEILAMQISSKSRYNILPAVIFWRQKYYSYSSGNNNFSAIISAHNIADD